MVGLTCKEHWLYSIAGISFVFLVFFFNDTATTEIYTLSLHDALPIFLPTSLDTSSMVTFFKPCFRNNCEADRKSTRLNSSHMSISYAVFCLKKKKQTNSHMTLLSSATRQILLCAT